MQTITSLYIVTFWTFNQRMSEIRHLHIDLNRKSLLIIPPNNYFTNFF